MTANIIWVSPCIVAVTAGGDPLKGTCTMSTPAVALSSSMVRCEELPLPTEA